MRRNLLLITLTCFGLACIMLIAWRAYDIAHDGIQRATFERLTALRESKRREIINYIDGCFDQTRLLAAAPAVGDAMTEFAETFDSLTRSPDDATDVQRFYREQYAPRAVNGDIGAATMELVPFDRTALAAQAIFLARNPHEVGQKDKLVDPGSASDYAAVHGRRHGIFTNIIDTFGFYDLFLIDLDGRIVYSVFKEIDFGTSLEDGPHSDSNLAAAFRRARSSDSDDELAVEDFQRYAPSYRAPAAFIATPIMNGDRRLGVLAVQIPIDRINDVMTSGRRWQADGLGASGETYLIGSDLLMRSDSRFILEDPETFFETIRTRSDEQNAARMQAYGTTILFQEVRTDAAEAATSGESGTEIVLDYRGIPVLSSYAPLRDEQDSWAILAEIDAAEAFAPVGRLRAQVFGLTGLVAMLFLALSLGLTRMIARNETLVLRREQVDRDLRLARSIQQGLLPKAAPSLDGYQIAGWSQPAEETGGDYFDWQTLPSGQLALSLADVTGHGIGPALVTAVCRAYTRASLPEADDLGVVMSRINELLHEDLPEDRFVTFVAALLDGQSHELHYLSAGHGPIVICRAATGELDVRGAHDIPFGLIGDQRYGSGDIVELEPGDVVVLITDGFFEWPAPDGTIFGLDRLRETLARVHTKSADDIIQALYQEVLTYAQGTSQDDDLTAVVVKRIATD